MYPAQALADGLYSADDLPDAIQITVNAGIAEDGTYVLIKNNPPISMPNGELCYYGDFSNNSITDDEIIYLAEGNDEVESMWFFRVGEAETDNSCLVISEEEFPSFYSEDQFADTYTVNYELIDNQGNWNEISTTVERNSISLWLSESTAPRVEIRYECIPDPFTQYPYKFVITISGAGVGFFLKTPYSNTPVGNYSPNAGGIQNIVVS
jgi:hypothetical protein